MDELATYLAKRKDAAVIEQNLELQPASRAGIQAKKQAMVKPYNKKLEKDWNKFFLMQRWTYLPNATKHFVETV